MPAAVIGGAIAAAGAVGSAVISSKGASKAAQATQAAADSSSALQQQIYNQNAAALAPWQRSGLQANGAINALLGIGGPSNYAATVRQQDLQPQLEAYGGDTGMVNDYGLSSDTVDAFKQGGFTGMMALGASLPWAQRLAAQRNGQAGTAMQGGNALTNAVQQPSQQQQYQNAFDNYRNSTGYQFRLNQGLNAINSGYAGAGSIKSGAAMKAINDYGQGMASQEFGNYLAALGNQQALGFGAASAQAGVGQNYANAMGNIAMNNAGNQANAALVKSQNLGNAFNSVGQIGGYLAGTLGGGGNYAALVPSVTSTINSNPGIF